MSVAATERMMDIIQNLSKDDADVFMNFLEELNKRAVKKRNAEYLAKLDKAEKDIAEGNFVTFTFEEFERRYPD